MTLKVTNVCNSCGINLVKEGACSFHCPNCGDGKIGRCKNCRDQNVTYECNLCGFRGP